MRKAPQRLSERLQFDLDPTTFKELLRDLLFREAGKPYFRRFAIPRRHRLFGAWRALSAYRVERQLLPVGGRDTDRLIQQFFTTHGRLRAEFQAGGMPVSAIRVLRQHCPPPPATLEQIQVLECTLGNQQGYSVMLSGGSAPPPPPSASE